MGRQYIELLTTSIAGQLLRSGGEFAKFVDRHLGPGGPVRRFPNGAIEIDMAVVGDEAMEAIRSCGCGVEGACMYQSLGPFTPKQVYSIQYPPEYQEKLRTEHSFAVGRGWVHPPMPGEYDLDHLEVTVGFRTRVGKAIRQAFVDAIAAWGRAAAVRGAFEDGPIKFASPRVELSGTRARFHIDARHSGQDTINWLILVIFDFGEAIHTVREVHFGSTAEYLDAMLGPIAGKSFMVEFPGAQSSTSLSGASEAEAATHVPTEARPDEGLRSRSFAVLALPVHEWDSFVATIYFTRSLQPEEREQLASLIDAWLLLGSYGGLGGRGTHSAEGVGFDEATDSAVIRADMGDADPEVALPILIRALEGFESTGIPVEALVFGRSLEEYMPSSWR